MFIKSENYKLLKGLIIVLFSKFYIDNQYFWTYNKNEFEFRFIFIRSDFLWIILFQEKQKIKKN